jgi:uncharacterized membrane protein YphA (DoxX/SURF4 family)
LQQHPGRPALAAHPPVRRLLVLRRRLHKLFPDGKAWAPGGSMGARRCSATGRTRSPSRAPGLAAITFEWYRDFLNPADQQRAQSWFAYLIVFGELAIGLGLIFGVLTGIAAFFGATMNMSFLLAGSASTNPILFFLGIGLMLGWRVAGYYGVDAGCSRARRALACAVIEHPPWRRLH